MFKQLKVAAPLILFVFIAAVLLRGLALQPTLIPSPLINKPAPTFELPTLFNPQKTTSNKDFIGHVTLVNIWASWCTACAEEHDFLKQLAAAGVDIYGIDYKDNPTDARKYLSLNGNPYKIIAVDEIGDASIDWGVYGVPETFIVDKKGMVRYKQIGTLTPDEWQQHLKPIVDELQSEKQ